METLKLFSSAEALLPLQGITCRTTECSECSSRVIPCSVRSVYSSESTELSTLNYTIIHIYLKN